MNWTANTSSILLSFFISLSFLYMFTHLILIIARACIDLRNIHEKKKWIDSIELVHEWKLFESLREEMKRTDFYVNANKICINKWNQNQIVSFFPLKPPFILSYWSVSKQRVHKKTRATFKKKKSILKTSFFSFKSSTKVILAMALVCVLL